MCTTSALRRGDEALQRDTRGMSRFNPGIEGKSVPDYNPYTLSKCSTCPVAKGSKSGSLAAFIPDNQVCQACKLIHQILLLTLPCYAMIISDLVATQIYKIFMT